MLRFPGITIAKNFRRGRSQYRDCSSMSEKDIPMGDTELFVDNVAGLCLKGASGLVGFVIGGLTSTGVSEAVKKDEEGLIRLSQINDEREMIRERMRKLLETDHKYVSKKET